MRREPDEIQATIMITTTIYMYILGAVTFLLIININVLSIFGYSSVAVILFYIVLLFLNLYILKYQIGFKKIIQEFKSETEQQARRGNILVTCYMLGALLIIYIAFYSVYLHEHA